MQRFRWMVAMIAIATMAGTSPVLAQGISIGGKLGATFATLSGEGITDPENRTGLSIGAFANVGISPMFSIQPELLLVQKGAAYSDTTTSGSFNFSYLEIPILARISLPAPGGLNPYVFVGPSASFKMGCTIGAESGGVSGEVDCDSFEDLGVSPKGFDFGVIGGLGAGMPLGAGQATLDIRYNLGLSGIYEAVEGVDVNSVKNRAFTVMLGYSIGLGG